MISKRSNSLTNELKCTEFYNLADKGFKVVLLKNSMSYKKTQKDNSIKSEKNEQNETFVKRKKSQKKNRAEICKLKISINEMKN